MAFKKPTPKKLSVEEINAISEASSQQSGKSVRQKTYDPNYPVFEIPVNGKVLAYVPNHTVTYEDGTVSLRMDKFAAHNCVHRGREYMTVRCTQGVVAESIGLDGSCPLCDALAEAYSLVHEEYNQTVRAKGGNPDDASAREQFKNDYLAAKDKMAVREPVVRVTFPIVVIECETDKNGNMTTTPKVAEDGTIKGTPCWFTTSEKVYSEKWEAALETAPETADGTPLSPAGLWVVLNYTYESKDGKHNKRDSAKSLRVSFKPMTAGFDQWASYYDKLTADWTPAKAMEVLVDNVIWSRDEQNEMVDELMKGTRDKLAMFSLASATPVSAIASPNGALGSAASALSQFGAVEVQPAALPNGTVPNAVPNGAAPNVAQSQPTSPITPTAPVAPTIPPQAGVNGFTGIQ